MGVGTGNYALGNLTGGAGQGGTMSCVKSLSRPGGKVTPLIYSVHCDE